LLKNGSKFEAKKKGTERFAGFFVRILAMAQSPGRFLAIL
jgi:hypothetical protein